MTTELIVEEPRGWATIPEAALALKLNRQTIRNRAVGEKIPGAEREPSGQQQWRIPGGYICDEVAKRLGKPVGPGHVDAVKVSWPRKVRGTDRQVTVSRTIWRTDELAARDATSSLEEIK